MNFRVIGFDNKIYKFNFSKNKKRKHHKNKSQYHIFAKDLIKEVLPQYSLYEEVTLPGSKKTGRPYILYADFFIPDLKLVIEVHGEQHYRFSPFFHDDMMDFLNAKNRDRDKIEWCLINNINILILPYNEKKQWKTLIYHAAQA